MNKSELIASVAMEADVSKKDAEKAVNTTIELISKALSEGEKVHLVGFGTFEVKTRAPRKGMNPKTGEVVQIPETKVATFRVGSALKDIIK